MKRLIAIALAAGLAAPAFAGGLVPPPVEPRVVAPAPPPPMVGVDWTGAYIGKTLGFGRASWDTDNGRDREDGFAVAGHVGYNMDMGNFVAGGQVTVAPGFNQSFGNRELKWGAAAQLRAGPKFGPGGNNWGFGTVGVMHARHDAAGGGDRRGNTGWLAGVGASHLMENNLMVTGEILHGRFRGDADARGTGAALGFSFRF